MPTTKTPHTGFEAGSQQRKTHASGTRQQQQQQQRLFEPQLNLHLEDGGFFLEGKRIISEEMPRPSVSRKGSGPVDLSAGYRPDWASRCLRHTFLSLSLFSTRVCEIFPADNRRIRGMKRPLKPIVAAANLHRVKDVLSGRARSPFDARTCAMRAERSVIK